MTKAAKTLELGCGRKRTPGAIGVDINPRVKPDVLWDLNKTPYPFQQDSFHEIICSHVLEHLDNIVKVMEELHRIGTAGCVIRVNAPYFTSINAYMDPTHRHFFTSRTFDYFCSEPPNELFDLDYSTARFRKRTARVLSMPGFIKDIVTRWINDHLELYEKRLAFIFPRFEIYYELEVLK